MSDKIKVDYNKMIDSISKGILENNENEFKGLIHIQQGLTFREEKLDDMIRIKLNHIAHNVLYELEQQLGNQLVIMEDGEEITLEED